MTYWREVISFIKADIYEHPSRMERPTLRLLVYGAWIVTLFQLSATFESAECLNTKRGKKGHGSSLVVVQSEKAGLGSAESYYFYSS